MSDLERVGLPSPTEAATGAVIHESSVLHEADVVDDTASGPEPRESVVPANTEEAAGPGNSDGESEFGDVLPSERGPEFFGPTAVLSFVKRVTFLYGLCPS